MKNYSTYLILLVLVICFSCSHSGNGKRNKIHNKVVPMEEKKIIDVPKILSLKELYTLSKNAVFLIYTSDGEEYHQGSGFFISDTGIGVSNYHVFEGTFKGNEVIKTLDGQQYKIAEVLKISKDYDYIIFRVDNRNEDKFPSLKISNEAPVIGDNVFAIGNPKGLESTLSTGIISSIRAKENLIQTTAEITNGSSGGPLFNWKGDVIGITSSGMGEANLNFAVDIRILQLDNE
jgi:serine protease Do